MVHKAKTHKEAGIVKKPSEAVYAKDILSDTALMACTYIGRSAWEQSLFHIWANGNDRVEGYIPDLADMWKMPLEVAHEALKEFIKFGPCDVLFDGTKVDSHAKSPIITGDVTLNGQYVTLINRRKQRASTAREQARIRKQEERKREASRKSHDETLEDVTPINGAPSLSSSLSPSVSKDTLGVKQAPLFINEFISLKKEKEKVCKTMWSQYNFNSSSGRKDHPEKYKEYVELATEVKAMTKQLVNTKAEIK